MARREVFQNSLSAGEIAPEYLSRSDIGARQEAAKTMTNVTVLAGGGCVRRPGTRDLIGLPGDTRIESIGLDASAQILAFSAGQVQFLGLDGSLVQKVTGAPWATSDLRTMQVAIQDTIIVVSSQSFWPQALTLTNGTWALAPFAFDPGLDDSLMQPYWRFPGYLGVAIQPSAYFGSITLGSSAPLFTAAHVGSRFRYAGKEIIVTAFTDNMHITGTVVGRLYPTININVVDSSVFITGQEISGNDSNVKGIVVGFGAGNVVVQLTSGYAMPDWTSVTVSELIDSPTGQTAQTTAPSTVSTPAATLDWDESLISVARGYPGACAMHKLRLIFGNFPNAKNMIAASSLGSTSDFDVGTGLDSDAIVELISQSGAVGVRHFGSTEQLLFFTGAGTLYVPEQVGAPLAPTNFDILKIGPEADGIPTPILVAEGMLYIESRSGRLLAVVPTGTVRRSWQVQDLSELAFHLAGTPVEIGLLSAVTGSDRKLISVRDDGVVAVMCYRRNETISAWTTWVTQGQWRSATEANGDLYFVSMRTIAGVPTYRLEIADYGQYGDGIVQLATPTSKAAQYAGQTVSAWSGVTYIGDYILDSTGGLIGFPDGFTTVQVGFDSQITVETVPPIDGSNGLRSRMRIVWVGVETISTGPFTMNGFDQSGFAATVGVGGAVGAQSYTRRFRNLGRSRTATALIYQAHAGPFEIRSVTLEVTS